MKSSTEPRGYTNSLFTDALTYSKLTMMFSIAPMSYTDTPTNTVLTMVFSIEPNGYTGTYINQGSLPPLFTCPTKSLPFPFHYVTDVDFTLYPQLYSNYPHSPYSKVIIFFISFEIYLLIQPSRPW